MEGSSMKHNIAVVLLISSLISMSTVLAFENNKPEKTLLIFSAEWCGPCKLVHKDLIEDKNLSEVIKNYNIIDVDYDVDTDLVSGYNVKIVPTFIIYQDGKELKRQSGYSSSKILFNFLK
jgi:thioredoxin 1